VNSVSDNFDTDLSILIPSYAESANLSFLLPEIKKTLESMEIKSEVIVIDAMVKSDSSQKVCLANDCIYINRSNGDNYGDAIRSGLNIINGRHVLFMDADGSHSPDFIPQLYKYAYTHDVAIASRYIENGDSEDKIILKIMSRVLNFTYSLVLGIQCNDLSNSYKLYKSSQLKWLDLKCNNFDIVEEIIYKIYKANNDLKIKEVPYFFKKRVYGVTKRNLILFIATYAFTIVRLKFMK